MYRGGMLMNVYKLCSGTLLRENKSVVTPNCVQTIVCTTAATTDRERNGTMAALSGVAVRTPGTSTTSAHRGTSES